MTSPDYVASVAGSASPQRAVLWVWSGAVLGLFLVAAAGLLQADAGDIDGLGLLTALTPLFWLGLGGLVLSFTWACARRERTVLLNLHVVAVLVLLAGAPGVIEPHPRFATAWLHAGFAEYVLRTGEVLPDYDARFSWPAFFAAAGTLAGLLDVEPLSLLRWSPVVLGLLYLLPLSVIVRILVPDQTRRSIALFLWVVGNWVGQDYFAPQGVNTLLYLSVVAVLLRLLADVEGRSVLMDIASKITWRSSARTAVVARAQASVGTRTFALVVVVVVHAASAVSHQLTQFFILLAVLVLVFGGHLRSKGLPVLLAMISLSYILWGAEGYWIGHLGELTGAIGDVGTSLQENVASRVTAGENFDRDVVIWSRLGMTAAMWGLAAVGLLRDRRPLLALPAALAVAPYLVLTLQSYGGEGLLRVHLASMPFLVVLAAHALPVSVPKKITLAPVNALAAVGTAALLAGLTVGFVLARYGNEAFEQMRPSDVNAVEAFYATAPPGAALYVLQNSVPFRYQALEQYGELALLEPPPWEVADLSESLAAFRQHEGPAYLLVTEGQLQQARQTLRLDQGYLDELPRDLARAAGLELVWSDGASSLYRKEGRRQ